MSKPRLCRLCLAADVRLFSIFNTPLQEIFEKITNISLSLNDKKPYLACYICHAQLQRFRGLISQAVTADQILTQILQSGIELNSPQILDRESYNLVHSYCTTPIELFSTEPLTDPNETIKKEVEVKTEAITNYGDTIGIKENDIKDCQDEKNNDDIVDTSEHHQSSESDDDVPLQAISNKKRIEKKAVKVRGKKRKWVHKKEVKLEKGSTADFAREIILSKEQQIQELQERATSLNYLNSPLKCELCYKGFVDTRAYDNHRRKHDEKSGPYECAICRMRYVTQRQLRTHTHTSHSRRYECAKCGHRAHTANQAREHEKWHSGYTYECKLCGQAFRKPTSYLTHMRKRHPTHHICNICGDSFVGRHGLLMHKSKTHRDDQHPASPSEPASDRFCSECNIQFANLDAWKRHILSSAKHTLASETSPQCKICASRFPSTSLLASHLREHERSLKASRTVTVTCKPTAKLTCDQCDSKFINRSKLQAHIKRKHLGLKYNKNVVCEVCGKKCTSNASLKYHQRTHTGEKPYQCEICHKMFADSNQLRIHTRIHTGERPYCCAVCGKRFSQKPALNRHYRVHTGVKPYICNLCSKPFSQSNSLKLHVNTVHLKLTPNRRNKQLEDGVIQKTEQQDELQTL